MIDRNEDGLFEAQCDECGDAIGEEQDSFHHAVDEVKRVGWVSPDSEGGWTHLCAACAREARIAAQKAKFSR